MIDITKQYTNRAGKPVRLISNQGTSKYPIVGVVDGDILPSCWTAEGKYHAEDNEEDHKLDLIEVPKVTVEYCRVALRSNSQIEDTIFLSSKFSGERGTVGYVIRTTTEGKPPAYTFEPYTPQ